MMAMRKIATAKALTRNPCAAACSLSSPLKAQDADLRPRLARDEIGDRHQAHVGAHADAVELLYVAKGGRQARHDVDFLLGAVGAVLAQLGPVGDHAHVAADQRHVGAELRGLGSIDPQLPFDAGDRPAVLDIDEIAEFGHGLGDAGRGRCDQFGQIGADLDLNRFADRRRHCARRSRAARRFPFAGPGWRPRLAATARRARR
jgi:hypothetical protein